MIELVELNEDNFFEARALSAAEDQKGFLDCALGIIARGYIYRDSRARVIGISEDGKLIGLALVKDMDEEPACYDLQQFMIDREYQGRGSGTEALKLILDDLSNERKYGCVEVCVKNTDLAALRVYEKAGFEDTCYIDPDAPDCLNLMYYFK
ncbi:MAG: GNAT family N-acetyltransferase [Clostridia bacterium]|nr:GNAT family N-acetyltransferase [Clostridia bacterium]